MRNVLTYIFITILFVYISACGDKGVNITKSDPIKGEPVINNPDLGNYDSMLTHGVSLKNVRWGYSQDIAASLTKKYGYDIYCRCNIASVGPTGALQPVLDFYCDWFNKENSKKIFDIIKPDCKKLGFTVVSFQPNPKTTKYYNVGPGASYNVE